MRKAIRVLSLFAALLFAVQASAQEPVIGGGVYVTKAAAAASYTGPGDIVGFTAWYGLRAYSSTTTGRQAVNLRNTSTAETCDFKTVAAGGLDVASSCSGSSNGTSLSSFCSGGGGSCAVTKLYDQTQGNACTGSTSCDMTQSTAANQPAIVVSCVNSLPCLQITTTSIKITSPNNMVPATGNVSLSCVGNRVVSGGTTSFRCIEEDLQAGNKYLATSNTWTLTRSGSINITANDNTWHAANGVINGASSVSNVDGTEGTGTITGTTAAGGPQIEEITANGTADSAEAGFLDNAFFSSGNRTSLCQNQQAYYGSGNFGAAC